MNQMLKERMDLLMFRNPGLTKQIKIEMVKKKKQFHANQANKTNLFLMGALMIKLAFLGRTYVKGAERRQKFLKAVSPLKIVHDDRSNK